jgi:hypothetical protein
MNNSLKIGIISGLIAGIAFGIAYSFFTKITASMDLFARARTKLKRMRVRAKVRPIRERDEKRERKFKLEPGYSYLVKDEVEKAFEIFVDQVMGGSEGLCITRERPSKIRQQYGLKKTPVIWLRKEVAKDETTVNSLQDLSIMINQFLKKAKHGLVLLDGFEYLVVNHKFKPCIQFLQLARSRFEENDGNFVVPILEDAF